MRKLANKKSGESGEQTQLPQRNKLTAKQEPVYLDNLPDYVKQTIITLVNTTSH